MQLTEEPVVTIRISATTKHVATEAAESRPFSKNWSDIGAVLGDMFAQTMSNLRRGMPFDTLVAILEHTQRYSNWEDDYYDGIGAFLATAKEMTDRKDFLSVLKRNVDRAVDRRKRAKDRHNKEKHEAKCPDPETRA